jgi:hypothetical protein
LVIALCVAAAAFDAAVEGVVVVDDEVVVEVVPVDGVVVDPAGVVVVVVRSQATRIVAEASTDKAARRVLFAFIGVS